MKGDFSRDSFNSLLHYSRVLQQQGRLDLEADGNERQSIQLYLLRSLAADVIGPQGGPQGQFRLLDKVGSNPLKQDFVISRGHYYVDGWLCENEHDVFFAGGPNHVSQPWWRPARDALMPDKQYLAYLDVWERHVSAAESDDPAEYRSSQTIREVALGGPDTTTRAQVVWQVKVGLSDGTSATALPGPTIGAGDWDKWMNSVWPTWRAAWQSVNRGQLKAKAVDPGNANATTPCVVSPQSRYRGVENQLYRIEIHRGGRAGDALAPTFVWSRENGSVLFAVDRVDDSAVKLVNGWRDARFDLVAGDVVELSDDDIALSGASGPLRRVTGFDQETLTVSVEGGGLAGAVNRSRHAVLRRWDHGRRSVGGVTPKVAADGRPAVADDLGLVVVEGRWLTIEAGISIWFDPASAAGEVQHYRSGDFWLIPARVAIGDVLWPRNASGESEAQAPHGVEHHYAPMAIVTVGANGDVSVVGEPPRWFKSLVELSTGV